METTKSYEIRHNNQFNSLEIIFDGIPAQATRDALKALKFRWHAVKKLWYGFAEEEKIKSLLDGKSENTAKATPAPPKKKAEKVNKYGIKVGDIFCSSWGYEQTNVDFYQVIALAGAESVRVVAVHPEVLKTEAYTGMSADYTYKITRDLLPAVKDFRIKDTEKGDLKRVKSYAADGVSNPLIDISSYEAAYLCEPGETKQYVSWYY